MFGIAVKQSREKSTIKLDLDGDECDLEIDILKENGIMKEPGKIILLPLLFIKNSDSLFASWWQWKFQLELNFSCDVYHKVSASYEAIFELGIHYSLSVLLNKYSFPLIKWLTSLYYLLYLNQEDHQS